MNTTFQKLRKEFKSAADFANQMEDLTYSHCSENSGYGPFAVMSITFNRQSRNVNCNQLDLAVLEEALPYIKDDKRREQTTAEIDLAGTELMSNMKLRFGE